MKAGTLWGWGTDQSWGVSWEPRTRLGEQARSWMAGVWAGCRDGAAEKALKDVGESPHPSSSVPRLDSQGEVPWEGAHWGRNPEALGRGGPQAGERLRL